MIIGVSGFIGSGKTSVCNLLEKHGFQALVLSDLLRDEAKKQGAGQNRDSLRQIGDDLRAKFGLDVLARRAIKRTREVGGDWVLGSVRLPQEADAIKKAGGVMVGVTAPLEVRYRRTKQRKREASEADLTLEAFKQKDEHDRQLGIPTVLSQADFLLSNEGTPQQLEVQVTDLIRHLKQATTSSSP